MFGEPLSKDEQESRRLQCEIREFEKQTNENKQLETKIAASVKEICDTIDNFSAGSWEDTKTMLKKIQKSLMQGTDVIEHNKKVAKAEKEISEMEKKLEALNKELQQLQLNEENKKLEEQNEDFRQKKKELGKALDTAKQKNEDLLAKKFKKIDRIGTLQNKCCRLTKEQNFLQDKIKDQDKLIADMKKPRKVKKFNL